MARQVKLTAPPGVEVVVRCIECVDELPVGELLSAATLKELLDHIYELDHEVIITARRRT